MNSVDDVIVQGALKVTGRLVDASNATLYAECTLGAQAQRVVYKPIAGERPLWDFPDGNLASREVAAFFISEIGKWELVPFTILRDGPFGLGMVQRWIDIDEEVDLSLYFKERRPELRSLALFDAVINNTDRKIGHLIPSKDGRLYVCDHGVTFHQEDKLRTVLWQWADEALSTSEITQLNNLLAAIDANETQLSELITRVEISALIARINSLLELGKFPLPNPDWPAVPWPPF